ncbi:hypothetical protein ABQ284_12020, partial [Lentilactobacillus buchneri]
HKGRHSLFLYNSEIFYAFTQDILRSPDYMYKTFGGFALEMDTVQLYVEMGGIGIITFISSYLSFAKNNLYVYVFMCLLIVNSIFSSGMASTFAWIVILIGMALIMVENNDALKEDSHE